MTRIAEVGDNSAAVNPPQLRSFVERLERLNEEKKELGEDLRAVFAEAKAAGFDTKIIRKVLKLRRMDTDAREEEAAMLELYCRALGLE